MDFCSLRASIVKCCNWVSSRPVFLPILTSKHGHKTRCLIGFLPVFVPILASKHGHKTQCLIGWFFFFFFSGSAHTNNGRTRCYVVGSEANKPREKIRNDDHQVYLNTNIEIKCQLSQVEVIFLCSNQYLPRFVLTGNSWGSSGGVIRKRDPNRSK